MRLFKRPREVLRFIGLRRPVHLRHTLNQPSGIAQTVGGHHGLISRGDHEIEVVLPLHGSERGDPGHAAAVAVVGDLPAEFGMAVSILAAVNPRAELVFAPDFRIVSRNDLRERPDPTHDIGVVALISVGVGHAARSVAGIRGRASRRHEACGKVCGVEAVR